MQGHNMNDRTIHMVKKESIGNHSTQEVINSLKIYAVD